MESDEIAVSDDKDEANREQRNKTGWLFTLVKDYQARQRTISRHTIAA